MWQVIGSIVGFLSLIYVWIGAFKLAEDWGTLRDWYNIEERRLSLWVVAILCIFTWPWTHYESAQREVEIANGEKEKQLQSSTNASRGSVTSIHSPIRGSRLYNERSLERPQSRREERVASFYDPYEHAQFYDSDPMALSELVGGDDREPVRELEREEYPSRHFPFERWETYSTPSSMEAPTAPSSYEPCRESSSSDSGVGSDSSWSSGSESSSGGYDSGGGSCGGE